MSTRTVERPVRVTIDGTAYSPTEGTLIVRYADGGKLFLPETERPGLTIEDRVPERTWTDGDVVQNSTHGWTLTRHGGQWISSMPGAGPWEEAAVTQAVTFPAPGYPCLQVLRYQAGEQ